MSEISDRFRKVAADFTKRVAAVDADAWTRPSPCEGWMARDIVSHIVASADLFLQLAGVDLLEGPASGAEPNRDWVRARDALQAALDDDRVASAMFEGPMGPSTLEHTMALFGIGDVLVHTWDLARATSQDERLDTGEVKLLLASMKPRDEVMRQGGRFGPRLAAPEGADEQTVLLAFTGRRV